MSDTTGLTLDAERWTECRRKYEELDRDMARGATLDFSTQVALVGRLASAAKTVPILLDDIDRLRAALAASEARATALVEALAGWLDSFELLVSAGSPCTPEMKRVIRGYCVGEPERARDLLAALAPAGGEG